MTELDNALDRKDNGAYHIKEGIPKLFQSKIKVFYCFMFVSNFPSGYSNIVDGVNSKMTSNDNKADELTARLLLVPMCMAIVIILTNCYCRKCTGLSKLVLVGHKTYHRVYETTKSKSLLLEASSNDNGLIRYISFFDEGSWVGFENYICRWISFRVDHTQSAVRYTYVRSNIFY